MLLKKTLSAILVASIATPAAWPSTSFAQTKLVAPADDAINIILQAMSAKTTEEARTLLEKAKAKLMDENLPPDVVVNVTQLLTSATNRVNSSPGSNPLIGSAPPSFSIDRNGTPTLPKGSSKTSDPQSVVAEMLSQNLDLYNSLREIASGRLERVSANLDDVVKATSTQSVVATDHANTVTQTVLQDAGSFIKALRSAGLLHDWSAANKALITQHDSVSVDRLAKDVIQRSTEWGVLAGAVKKLISASGLSYKKEVFGISVEALGVYTINADLVLRLADLYGMNLTESQQDVAILTLLPVAKLFMLSAKQRVLVKQTAEKLGELFGEAKMNPDPSAMGRFYKAVFASPLMANVAKKMAIDAKVDALKSTSPASVTADGRIAMPNTAPTLPSPLAPTLPSPLAPTLPSPLAPTLPSPLAPTLPSPLAPTLPSPLAPAAGIENAVAKLEAAAGAAEAGALAAANAAKSGVKTVGKAALSWQAQAGWLALSMVQSGVETYATGRVAMWWFNREKQKTRETETADFHAYLMSDKSKGFFKLMITAMNNPASLPPVIDVRTSKDPRAQFIINIARSVRICSAADSARFSQLQKQIGTGRFNNRAMPDGDYRLLRFECDSNLGTARFDQIAAEFMTFNSIPEWQVAQLRLANYEDRIQMGEIIMQLQFLLGEPNDKQDEFFQTTVMKILGLTRIDDANYFRRFYAFIRERGGMEPGVSSPTGFTIRLGTVDDPYASSVNYTTSGGPDIPTLPPVVSPAPVPPTNAPATPPVTPAPGTPPVVVSPPGTTPVIVTPPITIIPVPSVAK